jgi:hypothetical protein
MNTKNGMDLVQSDQKLVNGIATAFDTDDIKTKTTVLELLAATCLFPPNGHRYVLQAMSRFKDIKGEWLRFYSVVESLKEEHNFDYLITCMRFVMCYFSLIIDSFINSVVNFPKEMETRVSLRNEFVRLGILDIINTFKVNYEHDEDLEVHINIFEDFMKADGEEVNKHLASLGNQLFASHKLTLHRGH